MFLEAYNCIKNLMRVVCCSTLHMKLSCFEIVAFVINNKIYDIPPDSDVCVKKYNGGVHGWQFFYLDGANTHKCSTCGCYRSLNKPVASISPSCSYEVTQN